MGRQIISIVFFGLLALFGLLAAGCDDIGRGSPATLTGCLERGDMPDTYVLKIPAIIEEPTGTTGSDDPPKWTVSRTYRLDPPENDVDFARGVGARVTMSGRLERILGTSAPLARSSRTEIFHVSSVRKIADPCVSR